MSSEAFVNIGDDDSGPECDIASDSDMEETRAGENANGPGIFRMLIEEARNTNGLNSLISSTQNIDVIMRSALAYNVELRVLVDLRKALVEPYHGHEHILKDVILHGRLDYLEHSEHALAAYFSYIRDCPSTEIASDLFVAAVSIDRWDIVEWLHKHAFYITQDVFLKVYRAADSVKRIPRISKLYRLAGHFGYITRLADAHREDPILGDYVTYIREDKTSTNLTKYRIA
jgi:hypothetical protein